MDLLVEKWGLIKYAEAHQKQIDKVRMILEGSDKEWLIACRHYPVVTLGRQATDEDLLSWSGETQKVERGGRATYHGPNQIVIYPILNLRRRGQNIGGLLQVLQNVLVRQLQDYGLKGRGTPSYAGVWVEDKSQKRERKVASIGIAVKKWVTYHGLAFNISHDPQAFKGIASCGLGFREMTYLEEQTHTKIDLEQLQDKLLQELVKSLKSDLPVQVS